MSDWSTPFVSGSGLCYPSTDYSNVNNKLRGGKLRGGKVNPDGIIATSFGGSKKSKQRGGHQPSLLSFEGPFPNNRSLLGDSGEKVAGFNPLNSYGMIKTQNAGAKQKNKQRGGQQRLASFEGPYPDQMLLLGNNSAKVSGFNLPNSYGKVSEQSGGKKKSTKSKQRGGQSLMASLGPYPPVGLLEKSGDVSGYSEGTFATYNDSQKGGKRKQRGAGDTEGATSLPSRWFTGKGGVRKMKGGMETAGATPMPPSFFDPSIKLNDVPSLEGNRDVGMVDLVPNAPGNTLGNVMKAGGSKNKLTHKNKFKKGGMETGGPPMPPSFYNPSIKLVNVPSLEGNRNVGMVDLIPNAPGNTLGNVMKAGGSRNKLTNKNKFKKGGELIPRVSDPSPGIRSTINGAIDSFANFMLQLDQSYLNSVKYYQGLKVGGKKSSQEKKNKSQESNKSQKESNKSQKESNKSQEKNKSQKESNKSNSKTKNKKSKKQKGGDGSDFALTLGSRGACNAPDAFWGVDGETWFRQFNKSGDYIPNSQLAYAAAPLLTSDPKNTTVVGFDEMGNDYGRVNF